MFNVTINVVDSKPTENLHFSVHADATAAESRAFRELLKLADGVPFEVAFTGKTFFVDPDDGYSVELFVTFESVLAPHDGVWLTIEAV